MSYWGRKNPLKLILAEYFIILAPWKWSYIVSKCELENQLIETLLEIIHSIGRNHDYHKNLTKFPFSRLFLFIFLKSITKIPTMKVKFPIANVVSKFL